MKKKSRIVWGLAVIVGAVTFLTVSLFNSAAEDPIQIEINSWLVRDRAVPLEIIEMRSTIIVGFRLLPTIENLSQHTIEGELYINDVLVSSDRIPHLDSSRNNLGFDISLSQSDFSYDKPMSIPDGRYLIVIRLLDEKHQLLAQCKKDLSRNQLGRLFHGLGKVLERPTYLEIAENNMDKASGLTVKSPHSEVKDYLIFRKSYLERVYPHTDPTSSEKVESLFAEIARNEYKPITFSVRALKGLGKVQVSASPLKGVHGVLASNAVSLGVVNQLTEIVENESKKNFIYYRWAPKIIEPAEAIITEGSSQRYWLTLRAGPEAIPGDYHGVITVKPEFGHPTEVPFHVRVLPFRLTDTDMQYGMMMTYGFYELDNDGWTEPQKNSIKRIGMEIYRDFREHGLTMVYPHSHFYFKTNAVGEPPLESLKASLEAYKAENFPGPFCWYLGHLLQTAKPFHPGSIINYDSQVAKKRLRYLLNAYERIATEFNVPKSSLIVQLVDEPDQQDRIAAGKELNRIARQMGFKTLVTRPWPGVDVVCTGIRTNEETTIKLRQMAEQWWIYPNSALRTKNRAFTRYVFGFGAWHWGVDGVVPWTYQMSQGCNGNPFTVLDGPERMLAYPGVDGPITTPTWEAIRDGINDYKYIYRLRKLISAEKEKGNPRASVIERQLRELKQNLENESAQNESEFGDWTPESFEKNRKLIVNWALELSSQGSGIGSTGDQEAAARSPAL